MNIYVQKLNENAQIPTYASEGDFGCDVIATSEKEVAPGVWEYGLGLRYEMDRLSLERDIREAFYGDAYYEHAIVLDNWLISIEGRPKSGVWKRGMVLTNCIGTLDEFFRGEMKAVFYHVMPNMPRYKAGDSVVQMMVRISPKINWIEKEHISTDTTRGEKGFGEMDEQK